MADPTKLKLYNFYSRYNWQAADFAGWQDGMVSLARGMFEGLTGAAVVDGFAPALAGGLGINVGAGITVGPTGYLGVINTVSAIAATAPGTGSVRSLVVCRPNIVDSQIIQLPPPADPGQTAPLVELQDAVIAVIQGVPSNSPVYPGKQPNDTVLFGIRTAAGQSTLQDSDLDYDIRDTLGRNSDFQQDAAHFDDRCRPYNAGAPLLGIKPSQLEPPHPRVFTYVVETKPSIFPISAGAYNAADTFLNFKTGAVTGGDAATGSFVPTIPAAGTAVVAVVGLTAGDTLAVSYGTAGTRKQCFDGIKNRALSGAGNVVFPSLAKPLAFVVVQSQDGVNVTELDVFDARGAATAPATSYPFDVIIGNQAFATHATWEAAQADGAVGDNKRVLIALSRAVTSTLGGSRNGWRVEMLPGIAYTASGGCTQCLDLTGTDYDFDRCRFVNFTTSAIKFEAAAVRGIVSRCKFNNCGAEVDDGAAAALQTLNVTE